MKSGSYAFHGSLRTSSSIVWASSPTRMRHSPRLTASRITVAADAADMGALSRNASAFICSRTRRSSSLAPLASMPVRARRSRTRTSCSAVISLGSLPWSLAELMAMLVLMWPGMTTDAVSVGALMRKSVMRASVKPLTANLAALYAECDTVGPSDAQNPLIELVFTRWPNGAFCRSGRNARVP